jgi:predicted nucleic acid-binding protein
MRDKIFLDSKKGFALGERYHFPFWDSLIVATALENECSILYTEDLHHGQSIENKLIIKNPYIALTPATLVLLPKH